MLRQVGRELRFHPSRFIATVLAVAISVAFMAGSSILVATEGRAMQHQQSLPIAGADVVVTVDDEAAVAAVKSALKQTPGVAAAEPSLTGAAGLRNGRTTMLTQLIGVPSEPLRWSTVQQGRWPAAANEIVLTRGAAKTLGVALGGTVSADGNRTLTVVGLTDEPSSLFVQTAYMARAAFTDQGDLAAEGLGMWIVKAAPGTSAEQLAAALSTALTSTPGVTAVTADAMRTKTLGELTQSFDVFRNLLWAFAAIAAVVGMITIANTFTILLAQRRRQIGLLRAVGASGAQVRRRFFLEALALGVLGSALGLAFGAGLAAIGSAFTGSLFWGLVLPASDLSIAFAVGVLITVAAAYVPVLRGTRVRPLEALQPEPASDEKRRAGIVRAVVCGVSVAVGLAVSLLGLGSSQALMMAIGGSVLVALGVLFAAPLFVPLLLRGVGALVARFGVTPRLAAQNAVRNPRRASTTATALMLAVGLIVTLQVGTASIRANVLQQIDQQRPVDISVGGAVLDKPLPAALVKQLLAVPGVGASVLLSTTRADATLGDESYEDLAVIGYDPAAASVAAGAPASIADDEVYVSKHQEGVKRGQQISLVRGGTTVKLKAVPSPLVDFGYTMVSQNTLKRLGGAVANSLIWLSVPTRADGLSVAGAVNELTDGGRYQVAGGVVEAAQLETILNVLLGVTTALLGVAVLIALIGVSNTLGLSVLERTRESALMRALGLQARSLRWMLLIEALLLAGVGVLVGVAAGVYFGWLGAASMASMLNTSMRVAVDLPQTLAMVLVAVLAAALASVLPGRGAAKASPTEALADI